MPLRHAWPAGQPREAKSQTVPPSGCTMTTLVVSLEQEEAAKTATTSAAAPSGINELRPMSFLLPGRPREGRPGRLLSSSALPASAHPFRLAAEAPQDPARRAPVGAS